VSEEEIDLNDDHKPVTKTMLRGWLVKFGIPPDRIFEPTTEDLRNASTEFKPMLRNMLIVPYKYTIQDAGEDIPALLFEAKITYLHRWINVKLLLLQADAVPDRLTAPLYERLLRANYDLNQVTFSLSETKDIFVEADMPVETDYLNFETEYGSIEFGVEYFLTEIVPDLNECNVTSTFDRELYT
jgi:hypothetical protein